MTARRRPGPDMLGRKVAEATLIPERFQQHAAPEAIAVYRADWEAALRRLTRQIAEIRALEERRRGERERGEWPLASQRGAE